MIPYSLYDCTEEVKGKDLVLIGSNVLHSWYYGDGQIDENQFDFFVHGIPNLISLGLLERDDMKPIKILKEKAQMGMVFGASTIEKFEKLMNQVIEESERPNYVQLLRVMEMINLLAEAEDIRVLAPEAKTRYEYEVNEKAVKMINYINNNFRNSIN